MYSEIEILFQLLLFPPSYRLCSPWLEGSDLSHISKKISKDRLWRSVTLQEPNQIAFFSL